MSLRARSSSGETRHDPGTGVPGVTRVGWKADGKSGPWASALEDAEALVNLAGESIAGKRWTPQRKAQLHDSRSSQPAASRLR